MERPRRPTAPELMWHPAKTQSGRIAAAYAGPEAALLSETETGEVWVFRTLAGARFSSDKRIVRGFWILVLFGVVIGSLLPASSLGMQAVANLHISDKLLHFMAFAVLASIPTLIESRPTALVVLRMPRGAGNSDGDPAALGARTVVRVVGRGCGPRRGGLRVSGKRRGRRGVGAHASECRLSIKRRAGLVAVAGID